MTSTVSTLSTHLAAVHGGVVAHGQMMTITAPTASAMSVTMALSAEYTRNVVVFSWRHVSGAAGSGVHYCELVRRAARMDREKKWSAKMTLPCAAVSAKSGY